MTVLKLELLLRVDLGCDAWGLSEWVVLCFILLHSEWHLRFLRVGVTAGYGYVKYPLMPFFFRFNQTLVSERHEVFFHPRYLLPGHAPALDIDCDPGQVRGCGLALLGCGIAIVTAKFFLYLYCAHGRIHLNGGVELLIISFAQIVKKIARPRAAITTIGIKARIEAQGLASNDRNQFLAGDQLIELRLILDARQFEAVDFFVLAQQRIPGRAEYRIPKDTAEPAMTFAGVTCILAGRDLMQAKSLSAHSDGQKYQQKHSTCFALHEVSLKSRTANTGG
jgi:hypothetical protein